MRPADDDHDTATCGHSVEACLCETCACPACQGVSTATSSDTMLIRSTDGRVHELPIELR